MKIADMGLLTSDINPRSIARLNVILSLTLACNKVKSRDNIYSFQATTIIVHGKGTKALGTLVGQAKDSLRNSNGGWRI